MGHLNLSKTPEKALEEFLAKVTPQMDAILPSSAWRYLEECDQETYNGLLAALNKAERDYVEHGEIKRLRDDFAEVYKVALSHSEKLLAGLEPRQTSRIHVLKKEANLCRVAYEDVLAGCSGGKRSCKELCWCEAELVIRALVKKVEDAKHAA